MSSRPHIAPPVDKNWTAEEAVEAHEKWLSENPDVLEDHHSPLFLWDALQRIDALKKQFNKGDSFALLHAVRHCASHDLVMPDWVARGFIRGFDAVLNCRVGSWDEAFGRPFPKGKQLASLRLHRKRRFSVWFRVREILTKDPDTPIDNRLFERVAKELGINRSLASELYYNAKRSLPPSS